MSTPEAPQTEQQQHDQTLEPTPLGTHPFDVSWVLDPWAVWITTVISTVVIIYALSDTRQHSLHFTRPTLQRLTIRIQLMVPLYAALSVLCLHLPENRFMIATIRDTYESFVLYEFLALLIAYCGGEAQLIHALQLKRYKGEHPAPCCCLPLFALDRDFFLRCKRWVLQYALIKPITSALAVIGSLNGSYRETDFDFSTNLFPWFAIINNISITYSLWYLVVFHNETERELAYCRPMLKFVCIKTIIFFAYWQGLVITMLVALGFLSTGHNEKEREEVNGAAQDFLICVELIPVAIMHHYAFGYESFEQEMKDEPVFERIDGGYGKRSRKSGATGVRTDAEILDAVERAREEEKQAVQKRFQQQQEQSLASNLKRLDTANNLKKGHGSVRFQEPTTATNNTKQQDAYDYDETLPNSEFRKRVDNQLQRANSIMNNNNSNRQGSRGRILRGADEVLQMSTMDEDDYYLDNNDYDDSDDDSDHDRSHHTIDMDNNNNNSKRDDEDELLTTSLPNETGGPSISMNDFIRHQKKKEKKERLRRVLSSMSNLGANNNNNNSGALPPLSRRPSLARRPSFVSASGASGGGDSDSDGRSTATTRFSAVTGGSKAIPPHLRGADLKVAQQALAVEEALDAVETSVLREALALQDFVSDTVSTIFYQGGGLLEAGNTGNSKDGIGNQEGKDEFDLEDQNHSIKAYYKNGPTFIDVMPGQDPNDPQQMMSAVTGGIDNNSAGGSGGGRLDSYNMMNNPTSDGGAGAGSLSGMMMSMQKGGGIDESDSSDSEDERNEADPRGAGWCGDPSMMEFENDGEYPLVPWYDFRSGKRKELLADGSLQLNGQNSSSPHATASDDAATDSAGNLAALSLKRIYDLVGSDRNREEEEFCTVCGRNDREMVKRSSGWKCVKCVGLKHQYFSASTARSQRGEKPASSSSLSATPQQQTSQLNNNKNTLSKDGKNINNINSKSAYDDDDDE